MQTGCDCAGRRLATALWCMLEKRNLVPSDPPYEAAVARLAAAFEEAVAKELANPELAASAMTHALQVGSTVSLKTRNTIDILPACNSTSDGGDRVGAGRLDWHFAQRRRSWMPSIGLVEDFGSQLGSASPPDGIHGLRGHAHTPGNLSV